MDDVTNHPQYPLSSVQKVRQAVDELSTAQPADESAAQMLSALQMMLPYVLPVLPQDPDDFDELLLRGAGLFVRLRSDTAAAVTVQVRPAGAPADAPSAA